MVRRANGRHNGTQRRCSCPRAHQSQLELERGSWGANGFHLDGGFVRSGTTSASALGRVNPSLLTACTAGALSGVSMRWNTSRVGAVCSLRWAATASHCASDKAMPCMFTRVWGRMVRGLRNRQHRPCQSRLGIHACQRVRQSGSLGSGRGCLSHRLGQNQCPTRPAQREARCGFCIVAADADADARLSGRQHVPVAGSKLASAPANMAKAALA